MGLRRIALVFSTVLLLISTGSLFSQGLVLGLDFSGGTQIEVGYERPVDVAELRDQLKQSGFEDPVVVHFGSESDVLIRMQGQPDQGLAERLYSVLQVSGEEIDLRRVDFVGPQIGEELRDKGGLGMLIALAVVMLYVAIRFQFKFSVGAVLALVHDVVITLGIFSITRLEFDLTVLAAVLAVVGYSLNDTIVVSDRMRENFRTERGLEPVEIVDKSINQTLSRTLITSLTTLLVLFSLYIFGGELIKGFSLALILGIFIGTYSSIYVVANMLLTMSITQEDLAVPEPEGAEFDEMP